MNCSYETWYSGQVPYKHLAFFYLAPVALFLSGCVQCCSVSRCNKHNVILCVKKRYFSRTVEPVEVWFSFYVKKMVLSDLGYMHRNYILFSFCSCIFDNACFIVFLLLQCLWQCEKSFAVQNVLCVFVSRRNDTFRLTSALKWTYKLGFFRIKKLSSVMDLWTVLVHWAVSSNSEQ